MYSEFSSVVEGDWGNVASDTNGGRPNLSRAGLGRAASATSLGRLGLWGDTSDGGCDGGLTSPWNGSGWLTFMWSSGGGDGECGSDDWS